MTYASVMVAMDAGPDNVARVRLAAELADRSGARLIGAVGRQPILAVGGDAPFAAGAIVEQDHEAALEELRDVETAFRKAAGSSDRIFIRTGIGQPTAFVLEQARAADLIVIGRQGPEDHGDWRFAVDPGDIVLQAGRPVLVTPPGIDHLSTKRVIIAWKDTREARRAVRDALPFLCDAEEVFIVTIGASATTAGALDVCDYLDAHGIKAETRPHARREITAADAVIEAANQAGADLIVAGAYGHSRTREWIFGGVTRDLLDYSSVCCFIAH